MARAKGKKLDILKTCTICGADKAKACLGCGTTAYCSTDCQRIDWRDRGHRKVCKKIQAAEAARAEAPTPPPSPPRDVFYGPAPRSHADEIRARIAAEHEAARVRREANPEREPLSARFGSRCPICREEWDVNVSNKVFRTEKARKSTSARPDTGFKLNVWKRSMLERYAKFQDDLLDAAKRGDEPALMAGVKNLEGRQGKRMTARSKGVVGTWRARWSLEGTVPDDAAAVTVFARDGSEAEDPELRDPVLDVGAPLRCDCGGPTGTATPDGPATLAFAGLAALPFPAALRCTYLDERVFILRDAEDAVIVLERSA
ncbi:hypothetical protein SO694_00089060 [Aureococcus anophagefferens]|uniref:MYND-type domain-containing protein n=1 Tax=Aureococcus anophagefferens TaxID=44056 RepID=A0ABR1FJ01_AURAN